MMVGQARGDVEPSPYVVRFGDYHDAPPSVSSAIVITVNFNDSTRSIINASVTRDAGCQWTKLLIGIGADGSPDSTTRKVNVPVGTTAVPKSVFTNFGVDTIEEFKAYQITCGK